MLLKIIKMNTLNLNSRFNYDKKYSSCNLKYNLAILIRNAVHSNKVL